MRTNTRVYLVSTTDGNEHHLVRAALKQTAMRYVQEKRYTVRIASQDDMVEHLTAGVKVETATDPSE